MELIRKILEANSIPCESLVELNWSSDGCFYTFSVAKDNALHVWEQLRDAHPQTGYWPVVVLVGNDTVEGLFEWFEKQIVDMNCRSGKEVPEELLKMRGQAFINKSILDLENQLAKSNEWTIDSLPKANPILTSLFPEAAEFVEDPFKQCRDIWQDCLKANLEGLYQARDQFPETFAPLSAEEVITEGSIFDFQSWVSLRLQGKKLKDALKAETKGGNRPHEEFLHFFDDHETRPILLVKSEESWHVPAHLNCSNPNAPKILVHVAALKSWSERFGAELVEVSIDTLALRVLKPIEDFDEALKVAREHFAYCEDNVFKDDGSIGGLAQRIQHAKIWNFWWDF